MAPATDTAATDTATTDTAVADTATADTAIADTAVADTATGDTATGDTATADTATADTATADTGAADTATGPDADATSPPMTLAEVVTAALALANDATLAVDATFTGLTVTMLKPRHGLEAGGFFLQESAAGAAIYVRVDDDPFPAAVAALAPGDVVSIRVGTVTMVSGLPMVTAFTELTETGTDAGVGSWARDLDAIDTVDGFAPHLSALVTLTGTLTSGPAAAGGGPDGFRRFTFTTAGLPAGDARLAMRFPVSLVDGFGLDSGCVVEVSHGTVWAFRTSAAAALTDFQPSAYHAGDMAVACPAPTPVSATATESTQVTVTFSRRLDLATVVPGAFTITPTLAVTAATLDPSGKSVTLETAPQSVGTTYTVAVASSVKDVLGEPVPAASTVTFDGAGEALPLAAVWCFDDSTLNVTSSPGVTGASFTWSIGGGTFPQGNRTEGVVPPVGCAGATSQAASNNTWGQTTTPDFTTGPYFEVSFTTAAAGAVIIEFDGHRSSTGPGFIQPHYAGAALGDPMTTSTSFSSHPMFATEQAAVTAGTHAFRFYGYAASTTSTTGTFRVDNLVVRFAAD